MIRTAEAVSYMVAVGSLLSLLALSEAASSGQTNFPKRASVRGPEGG